MKYILLAFSLTLSIVGQTLFKDGINKSNLTFNFRSLIKTLLVPGIIMGFVAYIISAIIWLMVLRLFPLSIAYPTLSLTYIAIVFISARKLNEPLSRSKISGILLIIIGVYFLFR